MSIPEGLKYSETHQWAREESDGTVTVGITDHAQRALGDIVFVEPPPLGRTVRRGEACGVVESVKTASDVHAPLSGVVVAVNEALGERPEALNADPYAAWMFRVEPADRSELAALLDPVAYQKIAQD